MWAFLVVLLQLQTPLIDVCPAFGVPVSGGGYDRAFVDYAPISAPSGQVYNL